MAEKMKDSGVRWIGDVPESWEIHKIKYSFDVFSGSTPDSSNAEYWDGDVLWVTPADYNTEDVYIREGSRTITKKGLHACGTKMTEKNSIIFSKRAPVGKVAINLFPVCTNQGCFSCVPNSQAISKYFYYTMSICSDVFELNSSGSTFKEISADSFKSVKLPMPDADEQRAIAAFLDRRCAQIDGIIFDLERQIDLLKRYKKSLITETVTKGLDRNVPMKDSGVEWIGEIPVHWEVKRLKYCCTVKTGPFGTQLSADEYTIDGVPIINVKNIGYGEVIEEDLDRIPDDVKKRLTVHILHKGDIVFGRKGAVDKHAIVNERHEGWVQGSDCMRVRVWEDIEPEFLNYYFESQGYGEFVTVNSVGATMASVNSEILNNSVLVFPDRLEQKSIANFLNQKTEQINKIVSAKEYQLEEMKNYKQSLIYEYVTGKKRVKEVSPCPSEQIS